MASSGTGGPGGNKWISLRVDDLNGFEILEWLNQEAAEGYYAQTVVIKASDGTYLFAGNYQS